MKFFLLLWLFSCTCTAHAQLKAFQVKDNHKTRQIEQLQQLKLMVSRKADSLQAQLPQLASCLETTRRKIDQLKKESNTHNKPEQGSKEQFSASAYQLISATNQADSLRKQFDLRLNMLDQTLTLQKDLEDKITALIKENNR